MSKASNSIIYSLVNGQIADTVSIFDRGLLYGDGLFETIAVKQGKPLLLASHLQRLDDSAKRLHIRYDMPALNAEITTICSHMASTQAILRISLTRGVGGRGYKPTQDMTATRVVSLQEATAPSVIRSNEGISLALSSIRLAHQPVLAGMKHNNRLEQVLAAQEIPTGYDDVILLDQQNNVIECSKANIVLLLNDQWQTPDLSLSGVSGVMLQALLPLMSEFDMPVNTKTITVDSLLSAQAIFVCNSIIGLLPVKRYADKKIPIHDQYPLLIQQMQERGFCL